MKKLKIAGYWFVLIVFMFALLFIGAFREKFNVIVETEEQTHERYINASMEADADYYAELQRNLESVE